jgi:hypothetical protein
MLSSTHQRCKKFIGIFGKKKFDGQISSDVLITILSYHKFPSTLRVISKKIKEYIDTEEFYYKVCCHYGYENLGLSYKKFFLECVDISQIRISFGYVGNYNIWLVDGTGTAIEKILVFRKFATLGQIKHIFMIYYNIQVSISEDPCKIVKFSCKHPYKMTI